jgi:D-sedoheptulose 7-phosphate isomerase
MPDPGVLHLARERAARLAALVDQLRPERLERVADILLDAFQEDHQVFVIGNGGSAANASHLACDLGRPLDGRDGSSFRVHSLVEGSPTVSAIANDRGYEHVYAAQLQVALRPGDVLVAFSTSGRSPNIVRAIEEARRRGATVIAFLGADGGEAIGLAHEVVHVAEPDSSLVEDAHALIQHVLVSYVRRRLSADAGT